MLSGVSLSLQNNATLHAFICQSLRVVRLFSAVVADMNSLVLTQTGLAPKILRNFDVSVSLVVKSKKKYQVTYNISVTKL